MSDPSPFVSHTLREVARLLRVGTDRVRAWARSGALRAVNVGSTTRPRLVVLTADLESFLASRSAARSVAVAKAARRRGKKPGQVDFFPD